MLFARQIEVWIVLTIDHPYLVHRRVIFSATRVFLAARSVPYACNLHVFKHTPHAFAPLTVPIAIDSPRLVITMRAKGGANIFISR